MIIDIEDKNLEKFVKLYGINKQYAINVVEIKKLLVSFYNYMEINAIFYPKEEDEFKTNLDNNFKMPEV